jgi:hypothetical protein
MTSPTYAPTNEATGTFFFATFPRRHGRQSENCPSAHELDRPDTRFREVEHPPKFLHRVDELFGKPPHVRRRGGTRHARDLPATGDSQRCS